MSFVLFIIVVKVMTRELNNVFNDRSYKGYRMPKWSPPVNHLSYADDTILFWSGDKSSIVKIMKVLSDYEKVYVQLINRNKSFFYMHKKTLLAMAIRIKRISGIRISNFPLIYLGCPIFMAGVMLYTLRI